MQWTDNRFTTRTIPVMTTSITPLPRASGGRTFTAWDAARAISQTWLDESDLGHLQSLEAGACLYRQGDRHDRFYLVREGFLHTTVLHPNGNQLLLEVYGPGAIFGEASAFIGAPRYATITAVTKTQLSRYEAAEVRELMATRPDMVLSLLQLLGLKHRALIDKLASYTSTAPRERLLELLTRACPDGGQLALTHDQIGAMTGLSRVTVTRTLQQLAKAGLLNTLKGSVEVMAPQALREALKQAPGHS